MLAQMQNKHNKIHILEGSKKSLQQGASLTHKDG